MIDLIHEMTSAAYRIRKHHFDALQKQGVDPAAIGELSTAQFSIGAAHIEDIGGGMFQPSGHGLPACLLACCAPEDGWGERPLVDIVAFRTGDASRWWWRKGSAAILGEHQIANDIGEPVTVVATPADWLALAGEAVCILDWSDASPAWSLLRHGPSLQFSNEELRQRVSTALAQSAPMPRLEMVA